MAEPPKTPVAIRIIRPFANEEEFLARELETITRSSIVLLGAQSRPQGVVLRFEVVLESGVPLVRGEGRVTAYRENVLEGLSGLTLRFTRLDSRSKALVDRAAALRDARGRVSVMPSAPLAQSTPAPPQITRTSAPPPAPAPARAPAPAPAPQRAVAPPPSSPRAPRSTPAPSSRTAETPALTLDTGDFAAAGGSLLAARTPFDPEMTHAEAPRAKSRSDVPPALAPSRGRSGQGRASSPASRAPIVPRGAPPPPPSSGDVEVDLESTRAEAPRAKSRSEHPPPPPPQSGTSAREDGLARLRSRAKALAPEAVKAILDRAKRS